MEEEQQVKDAQEKKEMVEEKQDLIPPDDFIFEETKDTDKLL